MNHAWVVTGCRYHASYLSRWRLNYASYAHEPSFFLRGYPYDRAVNNHREMRKRNLKQKRFGVWEGNHLGLNLAKSWFKPSVYTKISSRCCPCGLQRDLQRQRIGRQPVLSFDRFSRGWGEAQSLFFCNQLTKLKNHHGYASQQHKQVQITLSGLVGLCLICACFGTRLKKSAARRKSPLT